MSVPSENVVPSSSQIFLSCFLPSWVAPKYLTSRSSKPPTTLFFNVWHFFTAVVLALPEVVGGVVDAPVRPVNPQVLRKLFPQPFQHLPGEVGGLCGPWRQAPRSIGGS